MEKYSSRATLDYTIGCYLGPDVSEEIRNQIYNLPIIHLPVFFFLVSRGESAKYALSNSKKWYDIVNDSIVPISYHDLFRIKIMGENGFKAGIKLKELLTQELS